MEHLAPGISFLDLRFLGHRGVIACAVLHGSGGVALIDPGPSTTLPVLRHELESAGLSMADVDAILLTHIHLDHAGATGTIVLENPRVRVYVHDNGARHLATPEKLIASATRLYGDVMDQLWGEIRPVPQTAIVALNGGETITVEGRSLRVAYTPGHASHHVSYFSEDSGIAFVGDTAGIRLTARSYVVPPTPPPDIDLERWRESLARIESWNSQTLFVTHFGPHAPPRPQLSELADRLTLFAQLAKKSLERGENDEGREAWFSEQIRAELRRRVGDQELAAYEMAGRLDLNWKGLARYWRKRAAANLVI